MKAKLLDIFVTWGYLGKLPWMPGTFGTLGAVPVVLGLQLAGPFLYMAGALGLTIAAIGLAQAHEFKSRKHDGREIVIDEVAGFVIAMTWLPMTWQAFLFAFAIFRLLDSVKPFPISWLDREVKGGLGVVVDDVAAGILTNIALQAVYLRTDWLGSRLTFLS